MNINITLKKIKKASLSPFIKIIERFPSIGIIAKKIFTPIALKFKNLNINTRTAIFIASIIALWMLTGIFSTKEQIVTQSPVKISIQFDTKPITATTYNPTINITGRIYSDENIFITSQVKGRVDQVFVKSGQVVKKGTWLLKLSGGDSGAGLQQAKASLRSAKLKLNADKKLFAKKLLSKSGYEQALSAYELAKANYASVKEKNDLHYIKAPFTGKIGIVRVIKNESVSNNQALLDISSGDTYKFVAHLSSNQVKRLSIQNTFSGTTANNDTISGIITGISNVPEATTKTYRIEGKILQKNFANGEAGSISVNLSPIQAHKIAPSLLVLNKDGNLGLKVLENNIVRFKTVNILNESLNEMWVSGLPQTVTIITKGAGFATIGKPLSE